MRMSREVQSEMYTSSSGLTAIAAGNAMLRLDAGVLPSTRVAVCVPEIAPTHGVGDGVDGMGAETTAPASKTSVIVATRRAREGTSSRLGKPRHAPQTRLVAAPPCGAAALGTECVSIIRMYRVALEKC